MCGLYLKLLFIIISWTIVNLRTIKGEKLWCYQCNTDVSRHQGIRTECNDPYAPGPSVDLVACPDEFEPHACLKAFILYKNIHVTVRACVPTRTQSTYCAFDDVYPEAHISCTFCNENSCNLSSTLAINKILIISLILFINYLIS